MGLIDFILNVAALLLWVNWGSVRLDPMAHASAKTLLGTLKKTGPSGVGRWKFLAGLMALLLLRPVLYWQVGSALDWTPHLNLAAVAPPFPSAFPGRMFLFSFFGFGITLAVFYLCLLFLAIINHRVADTDPFQKLVRAHLGRVGRWPWLPQLLLPLAMAGLIWLALHPLLVRWELTPATKSTASLFEQAALVGLGAYLPLRYLVTGVLFVHLLTSYVYLGNHPVWNFVNVTAHSLLAPLRWAPLRLGRLDFAPLLGIILVCLVAELAIHWLPILYQTL